jgi:hypothetical protein
MRPLVLRIALGALSLSLLAVPATAGLAQDVARALREKDDRERARLLETALRGADSADAAGVILDRVLPKAKTAVDTEVAVHALSRMREPEAVVRISATAAEPGPLERRAEAIEALGRSGADGAASALLPLAQDGDPRIRTAAVNALGERHEGHHDEALAAALDDTDWRVRSAAVWALARQGRDDVVPALANRMRKEEGRLVDDCVAALVSVTGERLGARPGSYLRLWADRTGSPSPDLDESWEPPPASIVAPLLDTRSRRVLIVLSTGESMKEEVHVPALSPAAAAALRSAGDDLVEAYEAAKTKMDLARIHATAMIRQLRDGTRFDVAVYAMSPTFAFGELVVADDRTRAKAEKRIARLSPGGGGNLSEMLRRSFDTRGKDPMGAARSPDDGPDTVILFSDGRLAYPGIEDRNQVVMAARRWNRVRQIRFLVVSLQPADDSVLGPLAGGPPSGLDLRLP